MRNIIVCIPHTQTHLYERVYNILLNNSYYFIVIYYCVLNVSVHSYKNNEENLNCNFLLQVGGSVNHRRWIFPVANTNESKIHALN